MINNQKRNNYSKQEKEAYSFAMSIEYPGQLNIQNCKNKIEILIVNSTISIYINIQI